MNEEIWKPIEDYEGIYEVSNFGRVRRTNGKIKMATQTPYGYLITRLSKNGKGKNYMVHRLVAQAFVANPYSKPCVNHLDECKTNNNATNLEWVTHKENTNYGTARQRHKATLKEYFKTHPGKYRKAVRCVETGAVYPSMTEAEKHTGANANNISGCVHGWQHTAGGYHWELA